MKKPITRAQIIADIERFCKAQGWTTTRFGVEALGDGAFFGRLSGDLSPTLNRIERVYDFMTDFNAKKAEGVVDDLTS